MKQVRDFFNHFKFFHSGDRPYKLSGRGLGVEERVGSVIALTNYPGRGVGIGGMVGSAFATHEVTYSCQKRFV
ncbi:MAG: hypothetical protein DSM106950_26585 [Stigonema ocellatum SAG 48.90 = DSM 106950]|nr:hypothetical protein [Stigonema ocellatum SAG 48.90 = DSM 106950]